MINGVELTSEPKRVQQVRQDVGLVFQQFHLFPHLTVLENCTLAPVRVRRMTPASAGELAMHYLTRLKAADQAGSTGRPVRRPAAAGGDRASTGNVAKDPDPGRATSALDPETIADVLDTIVALAAEDRTIVCVTHEMGFARDIADRVVFMDAGRIVESQDSAGFFDRPRHERARSFLGVRESKRA